MKKLIPAVLSFFLLIGFSGCDKYSPDTSSELTASQTSAIQIGQAVVFTLPSVAAGATVNWSVVPNHATISSSGNTASVTFQLAGNYTVSGVSGTTSGSTTVTVDSAKSSPAPPGSNPVVAFMSGEQLTITAARVDSNSVTSGLSFTAQTANSYNCQNNYLICAPTNGSNLFTIDYTGVYESVLGCTAGTAKAVGKVNTQIPFPTGTSTFTINFNGTKYSGTIVKTNNSYTITWPYTSGVVVSPTSL